MTVHRITLIPGDGAGPELVDAARAVVEASGVEIVRWDGERIGEAVNAVLAGHRIDYEARLRRLRDDIDKALRSLTESAA